MHIIGFMIFGLVIGLLARAVMPGDDKMGLLKTALLGMLGAVLAGWTGRALGWYGDGEGAGYISSTIGAVVVLGAYYFAVRGRVTSKGAHVRDLPRKSA